MILASERAFLTPELTKVESEEFKIFPEFYQEKIEEVKKKYSKKPLAILITYPDGKYGNLPNIKEIIKIAKEEEIITIINGAYSVGRMPISLKNLNADFIIASAHKSMACIGPLGLIAFKDEFSDIIFKKSKFVENKHLELLGCTARGLPTLCLYYVLPHLEARIKKWEEKVDIANYFIKKAESELGITLQGEKPHKHDLLNFKTDIFFEISQKIKDRYFLYRELKEKNIIGIKPGITKTIKLSTYLLSKEDCNYIIDVLKEIKERYL